MNHAARYAVIGAISLFALLWGVVGLTSIFSQTPPTPEEVEPHMTANLPNPQPPNNFFVDVYTTYPWWQIALFAFFAAACYAIIDRSWDWLLDWWYDRHDGEPTGETVEDAAEDPEQNHDAVQRAADVIEHELKAHPVVPPSPFGGQIGTYGGMSALELAEALAENGLIRGAGWVPPERDVVLGDDGELHPIDEQAEKVNS